MDKLFTALENNQLETALPRAGKKALFALATYLLKRGDYPEETIVVIDHLDGGYNLTTLLSLAFEGGNIPAIERLITAKGSTDKNISRYLRNATPSTIPYLFSPPFVCDDHALDVAILQPNPDILRQFLTTFPGMIPTNLEKVVHYYGLILRPSMLTVLIELCGLSGTTTKFRRQLATLHAMRPLLYPDEVAMIEAKEERSRQERQRHSQRIWAAL